jgi:hypothetical protein
VAIALPPVRINRARDIRIVQDILIHSGRAVWVGEDIARIKPAPLGDLERAVARVKAMFGPAEAPNRTGKLPSSPIETASAEPSASMRNMVTGTA